MDILIGFFILISGLVFGSFANVVIWRLPREESISNPPSHCPRCNTRLRGLDLIPVFSFLFLRGKCRHCGKKISPRYVFVELLFGVAFTLSYVLLGASWHLLPALCLLFVLICVSFIDFEHQIIPDSLLVFGGVVAAVWTVCANVWSLGGVYWSDALIGVAVGAVPLLIIDLFARLLYKKEGMGLGDVKLMAMVGLFLGWQNTLVALLLGVMAGGLFGAALLLLRRMERGAYMAFGPFLAIGSIVAMFAGNHIITWYTGWFI